MRRALVTGGAGFIGSHLVDALIKAGWQVEVIDNLITGLRENVNPAAVFHELDIRDSQINNVFERGNFDIVFHLAAQMDIRKSVADPGFDAEANILGGIKLLQACRKYKVTKVIFSSTCASYGEQVSFPAPESHPQNPVSPYGISKLAFEKYLYFYHNEFGIDYVILRYANIFGPRQRADGEGGVVAIFLDRLLSGQDAYIFGEGKQTRDFTYVADVVNANLLAADYGGCGIFNVSTALETDVNELFDLVREITGSSQQRIYRPAREGETLRSVLDNALIKKSFGWKPRTDIQTGLRQTAEFFKSKIPTA